VDQETSNSSFYCNQVSDCALVHTQKCFNNQAFQQACINSTFDNDSYVGAYQNFSYNGTVCPEYMIAASASCGCIDHGCSLIYRPG
jgi:hypothetical protein